MGMTAFATLPLGEEYRSLFKDYILWGRSIKGEKTPLTDFLKMEMKENQYKRKMQKNMNSKENIKDDYILMSA